MVIGHGDIASVIADREDVIFFASGVSNSKETHPREYQREMQLLMSQPRDKHIVYFSSLCIYYLQTEYARHKRIMEHTIKAHWPGYTIIRLGNIDWGTNPNTLINYLKSHSTANVQNVYRHVVSVDEFRYWLSMIPVPGQNEMNIPGERVWVPDLVKKLRNE